MDTAANRGLIPREPDKADGFYLSDSEVEFVEFEESEKIDQPLFRAPVEIPGIVPKDLPSVTFSRDFQTSLLENPALCRNVAIVGHLQHGKTSLVDMLVQSTHLCAPKLYTNSHYIEKKRGITISTKVMNLVAQNSRGKSYSLNLIDTPGHVDFWDQLGAGIDLCDSVLLVVDVCEPLMPTDYKAIEQALARGKKVRFCINKLDKLVIDQQKNLESATARIYYVIRRLENAVGGKIDLKEVLFASTKFRWTFTLNTITSLYESYGDATIRESDLEQPSYFAKYALGPLFKLYHVVLSGDVAAITSLIDYLGIKIDKNTSSMDVDELLVTICSKYFDTPVAAIVDVIPPPRITTNKDVLLHIVTFTHHEKQLYALAKVLHGKIYSGQRVKSGEVEAIIDGISLPQGQYNSMLNTASEGNIVLVRGLESLGCGHAVSVSSSSMMDFISAPLSAPIIKVGVTSYDPERLPILQNNLQFLKLTWLGLEIRAEGTGEHFVCGPGELILDCALYALRHDFEELKIRVAHPVVQFRETVLDDSYLMCTTETPDGLSKFSFLAEPLSAIGREGPSPQELANIGWDQLTIDSIVQIARSSNILVNEALDRPCEEAIHQEIIRGFREYSSCGPLCNEPVQSVAIKMSECELAEKQNDGQIAPIVRRACLAAHMVATPRLLEPILKVVCLGPPTAYKPLAKLLLNRRGQIENPSTPIPGTSLNLFKGDIPALDSAGFETELRGYCHDQIQVNLIFDSWRIIPGDPLDSSINVRKLEKAGPDSLARDILIKLRKRKGLIREPDTTNLI